MGTVTKLDFSKKKPKEVSDDLHGPFSKSNGDKTCCIQVREKSVVKNILDGKINLSQQYIFDNPNEKNWEHWEELYNNFSFDFIVEGLCCDSELYFDDKIQNEMIKVSTFFLDFFKNLYFMTDEGIDIILNKNNSIEDEQFKLKSLIYEYLLHFHEELDDIEYLDSKENFSDIDNDLDVYTNPKLKEIFDLAKLLNKKGKLPKYRKLSEYIEFFLEQLSKNEQVLTLIEGASCYAQKIIDRQVKILTNMAPSYDD